MLLAPDVYLYIYTGTSRAAERYKSGKKTTDVTLEILNLNKEEVIPIDIISNQEFTEVNFFLDNLRLVLIVCMNGVILFSSCFHTYVKQTCLSFHTFSFSRFSLSTDLLINNSLNSFMCTSTNMAAGAKLFILFL